MANKKIIQNEIGLAELFQKWWSFRKLVFFGTISISLLTLFVLIFSQNILKIQKQKYVTAVLNGDLGINNDRIITSFKSHDVIRKALKINSINLSPDKLIDHISLQYSTDPLTENLQSRVASLSDRDIKNLSLSNDNLKTIVNNLKDTSEENFTVKLFFIPLGLSENQAKNLIIKLTEIVNENLLLNSNKEDLELRLIDDDFSFQFFNKSEKISKLNTDMNIIQNNLSVMRQKYQELLVKFDIESYINLSNLTQKLLFEKSEQFGSTMSMDYLDIEILTLSRNIQDLQESLDFIENKEYWNTKLKKNQNNGISSSTTEFDRETFDKILDIGSKLNLNNFRLETLKEIQSLQKEKNGLIKRKDLLNLPLSYDIESLSLKEISKRISILSKFNNDAINQVRKITQPKNALTIIKNPELIEINNTSKNIDLIVMISIIGFLIISSISIIIPKNKYF